MWLYTYVQHVIGALQNALDDDYDNDDDDDIVNAMSMGMQQRRATTA